MSAISIGASFHWASAGFAILLCIYLVSGSHGDRLPALLICIVTLPVLASFAKALWEHVCLRLMVNSATYVSGSTQ